MDSNREIGMLSIAATTTVGNTRVRTVPSSLAVSIVLHLFGVTVLLAIAARHELTPAVQQTNVPHAARVLPTHVVFVVPPSRLQGGGTGGGFYRPGGSVTPPQLVLRVRPSYTASALDRRIQGALLLELVVTEKGATEAALLPGVEEAHGAVRRFQLAPRLTPHVRHRTK